jgi:hypothetical protein
LDALIAAAESKDAASAYPAFLQPSARGLLVHGVGADLDVHDGADGRRWIRERQLFLDRPWADVAGEVAPAARVQSEFHAVVVRRGLLDRLGGLDEGLLSWFDHTDLALHHRQLGAVAWFVPQVTCTYHVPPPVALSDLPSFLLRWGKDWYDQSLDRLCRVWRLDPDDTEWDHHARYRVDIRRRVIGQWPRLAPALDRAAVPVEHWVARRNARPSLV